MQNAMMHVPAELDLFSAQREQLHHAPMYEPNDLPISNQFALWKNQIGSKHVLKHVFKVASRYGMRYIEKGQRVSVKLIWELVRDEIKIVRKRCKRRGIEIKQWEGYTLNNIFTPYIARHIISRRPEWDGMFELRDIKGE